PTPADALVLRAETGPEGVGVVDCAAPGAEAAAAVEARAAAILGSGASARCRAVPGVEEPGWTAAAAAAMDALSRLPGGEISLLGRRARLTGAPPTRARALAEARAELAAALPEGYRLAVIVQPGAPSAGADLANPFGGASAAQLDHRDGVLTLEGAAPSRLLIDSVVAFARAALPGARIEDRLRLEPALSPVGWRAAMTSLVSVLGALEGGRARLSPDVVRLEGETPDLARVSDAHRFLKHALGAERDVSTSIRVLAAAQAAAQPLPPARCADALSAVTEAEPILFAPGSAEIDEASAPVLERLAAIFPRCVGARIEIGGHTDSQGRESTNISLSRARAEAVLAAILSLDDGLANLSAVGYGEAEPIADNGTEEGRARNRRIAFRAVAADEAGRSDEAEGEAPAE
ncbi:MAG: OmpA family protein, partial [Pseudomonadota bacterium]